VWDAAVRALRTATRIVILGYSIPPIDAHFKYLLAAGLQENISLRKIFFVNPALDGEHEAERLNQGGGAEQLRTRLFGVLGEQHFMRGIIEFAPEKTSVFFHGPRETTKHRLYRECIGRPLPAFYTASKLYVIYPPYF
jgi:hypothetical protein